MTYIPRATELAPGVETFTGEFWDGAPVYAQRFTGTMPTSSTGTLVSGVAKILAVSGHATSTGTAQVVPAIGGVSGVNVLLTISTNDMVITNYGGAYDAHPYDFSVKYTKL